MFSETHIVSVSIFTSLYGCAAVAFHFGKVIGRDELLEDLHQILYARKGKV